MKLFYRILLRLSIGTTLVLTAWAALFYVAIIDEINDEVDDSLEDYSETIIIRSLAKQTLPSETNGSNNQYFITEISRAEAEREAHIRYQDSMVYIKEKGETEPARILTTIFRNESAQYFRLTVSTPTYEKEDLREAILNLIISLYIALLIMIMIISMIVLRKNFAPLYRLLDWLDKYRFDKRNAPLENPTSISEFQTLNNAVQRFAARGEELFEQQKQFIGNASHEMQTPLAICQNRIEMLMEDESLPEPALEELLKTQQTLEHAARLNKSLLLLSKIDNSQFSDTKTVELNGVLKRFIDDYKEVFAYQKIRFSMVENGTFSVEMNEMLATVLVTNLLKNAYTHNVTTGAIDGEIDSRHSVFRNTGTATPLDGQRIFERFYQGTKKEGSTGLGLAIAQSICKSYSLRLAYAFADGRHQFTIEKI